MDIRVFLDQVLAWDVQGYTTLHGHDRQNKIFQGRSCLTLDNAIYWAQVLAKKKGIDVYFCLSRQKLNSGKRSQANALAFRSLFMDADVEKGNPKKYQSLAEAIAAILKFCDELKIPRPSCLVASGGGVHAYWFSDRSLPVDVWQGYADALKSAGRDARLKFDAVVTSDAARVLRVPETFNWKYGEPRRVWIVDDWSTGVLHDFSVVFAHLEVTPPPPKEPVLTVDPAFAHLKFESMAGGIEAPPVPKIEDVIKECGWLREAYETGGKDFDEPQWNLTTLAATFMEDGNELAHRLGNKHPDYDHRKTEDKRARKMRERGDSNIGWPSCRAISNAGATHCATCKHRDEGKSPLNFGSRVAKNADTKAEIDVEIEDEAIKALGGSRPEDLQLPDGFAVDEYGRICAVIAPQVVRGKQRPPRLLALFLNTIRKPTLQYQDGMFGIAFIASTDKAGEHEVFLSSRNTYGQNMVNHLASKCVLLGNPRKAVTEYAEMFAGAWLDKLRKLHTAMRDAGTLGWRYENGARIGFAYGGLLHLADGTTAPLTNISDDEFRKWYMPIGKKEVWLRACKLLTDRKQPELDVIIAVAFAAPLVVFIGNMYGAIVSIWGEPGTAKSTAQQVAAALFGHPKQTRESLTSTPKSVQGRLGRIKNLPAYWDDIQDERHQDYLAQTMFVATEGTEGGRLNPDASYKERKDWQTMLLACSNASFVEYLLKKQKSTTAGLRRVLEFQFNKSGDNRGMVDAVTANRTFAELEHNYGMMGMEYARMLATRHNEISEMVKVTTSNLFERTKGGPDETFWIGLCGTLIVGAKLACELGAEINVPVMTEFLVDVLTENRRVRGNEATEGGSKPNTEMGLSGFLNKFANSGNIMYVERMFRHRSDTIHVLHYPEKQILIQVARDERKIVISKRALREHLQDEGIHARQVLDGMVKFYKAKEIKVTLGGGTTHAQTQELCLELFVPIGDVLLEELLFAKGVPPVK